MKQKGEFQKKREEHKAHQAFYDLIKKDRKFALAARKFLFEQQVSRLFEKLRRNVRAAKH
jgi:hypothetical protein